MVQNDLIKSLINKSIFTYIMMFIFGASIIAKVLYIQVSEGEELRKLGKQRSVIETEIEALRGNIYSSNNSLLAVTTPKYEIRLDMISNKSDQYFNANVDELAEKISLLFKDRSKHAYKKLLQKARAQKNHYLLLKRDVDYKQYIQLKSFPILKEGRNKGGLIALKTNRRELPYRNLAKRTIGIFNYEQGKYIVGLEGAFNETLKGTQGKRMMQMIDGGILMPIDPANELKPKNGNDVVTCIDIDIQDVAEDALKTQLKLHNAHHGCAIVMEVATGEIKAIANLGIEKDGSYTEKYNYAIGEASEPGSTFKTASMLVALEDHKIELSDSIDTGNGSISFYGKTIRDSHKIGNGIISGRDIIEQSSNVGIAKVIWENYQNDPQKFIDGIYKIGLQNKLNLPIKGEASPYIKNPQDKSWSGISLPWIAYGYELHITPLQTLTFYNAIANHGRMMKPLFVKEIRNTNEIIETREPIVINDQIATKETITKLQSMLEGVVLRGTAKNIKNKHYSIAGKTGTAQIAQNNRGYNRSNYKASFCGYFPANNPKYSCIVVINNPSKGKYYGSSVAAPVFKTISDHIYASHIELEQEEISYEEISKNNPSIFYKAGACDDYEQIFKYMNYDPIIDKSSEYVICLPKTDSSYYAPRNIPKNRIPKVIGMTAKDAVYLLEELGMNVQLRGRGFVKEQSLPANSKSSKGKTITLKLSNS
ncbi:MAG: cell division protein [Bacteroidetes bacterium 4572_77]|nr:MAG: cell division protein [Bacteroidetes bacterium 4572_77]